MAKVFALTGTPGTGKSTVAALLRRPPRPLRALEVADLSGASSPDPSGPSGARLVDLRLAAQAVEGFRGDRSRGSGPVVLVGHLSHLLPVQDVLLLRCRPSRLAERLRAKRVDDRWVQENRDAELLDVILQEALHLHRTVFELDTTERTPEQVAEWVRRVVRGQVRPAHGGIDWLSEEPPTVATARQKRPGRSSPARRRPARVAR